MMRLAALSLEHCLPTVSGEARVAEQRFESPQSQECADIRQPWWKRAPSRT